MDGPAGWPADNLPNSDGLGVYHRTVPQSTVGGHWQRGLLISQWFGLNPDPDLKCSPEPLLALPSVRASMVDHARRLANFAALLTSAYLRFCRKWFYNLSFALRIDFCNSAFAWVVTANLHLFLYCLPRCILLSLILPFHHVYDQMQILILLAVASNALPSASLRHSASHSTSSPVLFTSTCFFPLCPLSPEFLSLLLGFLRHGRQVPPYDLCASCFLSLLHVHLPFYDSIIRPHGTIPIQNWSFCKRSVAQGQVYEGFALAFIPGPVVSGSVIISNY